MLANQAHVSIGGVSYLLAEDEPEHYVHTFQPTVTSSAEIVGEPGKRNIRPGRLLWEFTDWSGGEGNRIYYPDQPTMYDRSTGGANPRIRGELFGPPTQTTSTITTGGATAAFMGVANGKVWVCSGRETYYSSNGTSFSAGPVLGAGHEITAVCGSEDYLYVTSLTGTTRYIYRCTTAAATEVTNQVNSIRFGGMAIYQGWLYGWTGRKLWAFDITQSLPLTTDAQRVKIHDTGTDPAATWGNYFIGLARAENSLVYFMTHYGESAIYEYSIPKRSGTQPVIQPGGVGKPLWYPGGQGFNVRSICVQNQIVYAAGHWGTGTDGTGRAQIYLLPLARLQPEEGPFIRKAYSSLHLTCAAPSYGSQILLSDQTASDVFIYDTKTGGVSELDAVSEAPTALMTWGPYRYAAGISTTTVKLHRWPDDEPGNRAVTSGATVDTGNYDFGLPFETKVLLGFHVGFSPMIANQSITISYQADDVGSWTALTALTSATTGNSSGRIFAAVSASPTFHNLKFRIVTAGTSGAQDPIVYSVTAEATVLSYERVITLKVRTKDETPGTHVRGTQRPAKTLRSNLYSLATTKAVVTLLDGYGYKDKDATRYDTYTGYVDGLADIIKENGEGVTHLNFRVTPT